MMKNIKHNAAQVAAPSNLSSSHADRFLRVCGKETGATRTMKHLLVLLVARKQRIQMMEGGECKTPKSKLETKKNHLCSRLSTLEI